jgi:hypothetical protein
MIPSASAGDVEQVTLGVINLLEVGIVTDSFDAFLQGQNLIIASHHDDSSELQTLGQVHCANRGMAAGYFDVFIEYFESHAGLHDAAAHDSVARPLGRRHQIRARHRLAPVLGVAIHIGQNWAEQPVCLRANLVGGSVVDAQRARAPSDVYF